MPVTYELRLLADAARVPAHHTAALHRELLAHSPVVLLGRPFGERFYYKTLVQEGYIRGLVAYVDGVPAGFVVATTDSAGFMGKALRRHPFRIGWLLGLSVLRDPRRLGALWEAWRIMRGQQAPVTQDAAEILSFGVLPEFRDRKFFQQTGIKISLDLMDAMICELSGDGVDTIRVVVDEDNLQARLFYQAAGFALAGQHVPGWRKVTVEYVWRASDESSADTT